MGNAEADARSDGEQVCAPLAHGTAAQGLAGEAAGEGVMWPHELPLEVRYPSAALLMLLFIPLWVCIVKKFLGD